MVVGFGMVYRAPLGLKYILIVEQLLLLFIKFSCLFDVSFFHILFFGDIN